MLLKNFTNLNSILPIIFYKELNKEIILVVLIRNLIVSLNILKYHVNYQYKLLSCISGVDLLHNSYRFCVSYDLLSLVYNSRIRIKTFINETAILTSSISIYINANWWEREIWDLFGIYFEKHNDLRRLLTDYGFEGHPLKKDFPLSGYVEVRYDDSQKRVVSESIEMSQEYRIFNFKSFWD